MEKTLQNESLLLTRVYAVAPQRVWRAWTEAAALRTWFGQDDAPGWKAEMDVRVGGRYHLVLRHPQGFYYDVRGIYREVVPNHRLVFTWDQRGELAEGDSLITVELIPAEGGTQLRFTQDPMFDPTAPQGWRSDFKRLGRLLKPTD
jgi:uncharacterized protein YndB with AHSA1/START domain